MMQSVKNKVVDGLVRLTEIVVSHPKIQSKLAQQYNERFDTKTEQLEHRLRHIIQDELKSHIRDEAFQSQMLEVAKFVTADKDFAKDLWRKTNVRPHATDCHWAVIPNSIREHRMQKATMEAADFIMQEIPHLEGKPTPFDVLTHCLSEVAVDGLYLEFGVFSGVTINHIASKTDKNVHGFDSFEGLPEAWGAVPAGYFHTENNLPEVSTNVELHKGWFDQTLPGFIESHPEPVAFLHADADLYSSTKTILWNLQQQIVPGTIIVFDEYLNYPYWREHEYKAFTEFCAEFNREFEYIAYADRGYSVAVKIK